MIYKLKVSTRRFQASHKHRRNIKREAYLSPVKSKTAVIIQILQMS